MPFKKIKYLPFVDIIRLATLSHRTPSPIKAAKDLAAALSSNASLLVQRIESDRQLIAARDQLISKQNAAVLALAEASKVQREAYETRIAAADKLAQARKAEATAIMAREAQAQDELGRAREALQLIQEVVAGDNKR